MKSTSSRERFTIDLRIVGKYTLRGSPLEFEASLDTFIIMYVYINDVARCADYSIRVFR